MKNRITPGLLVLILIGLVVPAWAQEDLDVVSLSPFEIVTPQRDNVPAVSIKRRADFVSVPVTITCSASDAAQRIEQYRAAVKTILDAATKAPNLKVLNGEFSLSAANRGGSFFRSRKDGDSSVVVQVLGALTDGNSVFDRAGEIKALVDGLTFSKQIKVTLGQTSLTVTDPEQYRAELIKLIVADFKMVRAALGEKVEGSVSGLEGRVQVRQVDEQNVRLYIGYSYGAFTVGEAAR